MDAKELRAESDNQRVNEMPNKDDTSAANCGSEKKTESEAALISGRVWCNVAKRVDITGNVIKQGREHDSIKCAHGSGNLSGGWRLATEALDKLVIRQLAVSQIQHTRGMTPNDPKLSDGGGLAQPVPGSAAEAQAVTDRSRSLERMVRRCGPSEETVEQYEDEVWHRLEKFVVVMRKVNAEWRAAMQNGRKAPPEQVREAILLAVSGCRVIREAAQQLAASVSDPKNESPLEEKKDSEGPAQGCS